MNKYAKFITTLVYFDEIQLAVLSSGKSRFIAMAIDQGIDHEFIVTSVTNENFRDYLNQIVDLRYLFTFPHSRSTYFCKIVKSDRIKLIRHDGIVADKFLPERGFFASSHTHKFELESVANGHQLLKLDGRWELQEFGKFQNRFSDIYSFISGLRNLVKTNVADDIKRGIRGSFLGKPLRGGSSYGSLFSELEDYVLRPERLQLSRIRKASPGEMELRGSDSLFLETERFIKNYLDQRPGLETIYGELYGRLQTAGLLSTDVDAFKEDHVSKAYFLTQARLLAESHGIQNFDQIYTLCQGNTLATSKVVLALHRRVRDAAVFFAQGRVAYAD